MDYAKDTEYRQQDYAMKLVMFEPQCAQCAHPQDHAGTAACIVAVAR